MATVTFQGDAVETVGDPLAVGDIAAAFELTDTELGAKTLADYPDKKLILNVFPSIDTSVCAATVRAFNEKAAGLDGVTVLCISADLPFAQARFCGAEGIERVEMLSAFRSPAFGKDYGLTVAAGPLAGLLTRAVFVLDADRKVVHAQVVPEITDEPDYDAALAAL